MVSTRRHVLYVDPDGDVASRVVSGLEAADLEVTHVAGIEAAESHLQDVDCCVSAYRLEGATAIDCHERFRQHSDRPFIVYADACSPRVIQNIVAAGVTEYIPRVGASPRVSLLADRIETALENASIADQQRDLTRINSVLRTIIGAIVTAESRETVDRRICEIISNSAPYIFAWIGEHQPETETVAVRESAGIEAGYLDDISITTDDTETARGPTGQAIRTGEIQVMQNIRTDPRYEPWRADALARGYQSSAAIPLIHEGTTYGVLNIYANRPRAFDEEERTVLEELGALIARVHHDLDRQQRIRRFRRAVEQAADAIFITDTEGTIEYANPSFEAVTGYSPSEAVGRNPRILKSGEMPEEYYERMWDTIRSGDIWEETIVNETRSGDQYFAEQTVAPIIDDHGEIEGFVAIQRDVTERKRRERKLRRRRERLRVLFDDAPDGIVIHDVHGAIIDVNSTLVERLGYTRDELLSMNVFDFETGVDPDHLERQWRSVEADEVQKIEVDGKHLCKDGSTYPVEVWVSKTRPSMDDPDQFIAIARDVSDRKQWERELRERQRRYAAVVDNVHDGLFIVQGGRIKFVNARAAALLGYRSADLRDERFTRFIAPEHRETVRTRIRDRSNDEAAAGPYYAEVVPDGDELIPVEISVGAFEYGGRPAVVIAMRDITERVDRTRQLRVLDRVLRHNLRNQMTLIQGYAETIRDSVPEAAESATTIMERCAGLMQTVDKEQEIVETIAERPVLLRVDLAAVCGDVRDNVRETHPAVAISLEVPTVAEILASPNVERAVEELVENAIDHHDRDHPRIWLDVDIDVDSDRVTLTVTDDGPGIPAEEVNVLTREYEVEPLYHGSGLGLWLVNWIVRRSKGTLEFDERSPRGSIVTMTFRRPGDGS